MGGDFFVTLIIPENFVPQNTSDLDKAGEYINNELNRVSNTPKLFALHLLCYIDCGEASMKVIT